MNPGRQENINGRYWNLYAANGNWVYGYNNPASRTRNYHARGFGVRVGKNKKDDDYADNVVASINFGADVHTITHTNALTGCGDGADYLLTMWEHYYSDALQCNALNPALDADIPGGQNQWQDINKLELERNAPNGDCYVELQFHTNQSRQSWLYA
ncbi:MAG: hypothetical protein ABIR39_10735, partial [Nocardioides sp.]|uniref:hypothetical protein n=1 Tax=Nocardioides sp. TaxID=35761 RepID=UPI003263130E